MLYDTEGIKTDADFNKAMVGVASVWQVKFTVGSLVFLFASQVRG